MNHYRLFEIIFPLLCTGSFHLKKHRCSNQSSNRCSSLNDGQTIVNKDEDHEKTFPIYGYKTKLRSLDGSNQQHRLK
jgi:hypothetical protein